MRGLRAVAIASLVSLAGCAEEEACEVTCAAEGRFCEAGVCVDAWRYGAPQFSTCAGDPHATAESLSAKAARYDEIATRLHIHPQLGVALDVMLRGSELEPATPEDEATIADVERWQSGENDGSQSAFYLASQAYRYAATQSDEALATIRVLLAAEVERMRITGVPGLFTRQLIPPNVPGIACPTEDARYTRDVEKDDNAWVQIRDEGCVWFVDDVTGAWTKSDHCGLEEFAGYCFLDNVSKDEYAGHMLALTALLRFVDVPDVQASVVDLLGQIGDHLLDNSMTLIDWDGRPTEHGHFSPIAFDDFPGFNAAMALAYVGAARIATGREDLDTYFERCLLQRKGGQSCLGLEAPEPFTTFLEAPGLYLGTEGCRANYNNISMQLFSLHTILMIERDPLVRDAVQVSLDVDVMNKPGEPRAIIGQHNALFDFIWAAGKKLGPDSDGPAFAAVEDAVCQLRQFRASQAEVSITPDPVRHAPYCKNRFGEDVSHFPREAWERCSTTLVWGGDPYDLGTCAENRRAIAQPAGYLLPYWMGRFYGFIAADL